MIALTPKQWLKVGAALALAAVVTWAVISVLAWDRGRLNARYNEGRNDERDLWEAGQALAKERQDKAAREATAAAEAAGDTMRAASAADSSTAAAATQSDVDTITKAHTDAKTPACAPDSAPAALPPSVLDALQRARGRASRTAATPSR